MRGNVIIIGAGFGGLSCAIRLASQGVQVTILERQQHVGGKLQQIERDGYHFDRGPSTITMPSTFRSVFDHAGVAMEDYVQLYELEPRTRNIFADGTVVDLSGNRGWMKEQIATYSPEDAARYDAFMDESAALYAEANRHFLGKLLLSPSDKYNLQMLRSLLRVRPTVKLDKLLRSYFQHPHTLAMFGRYATYVGSSPYQSPSIFAMMGHVEAEVGIYGVKGGTYQLIEGMTRLAREKGVQIITGIEVRQIVVRNGKVAGVDTDQGFREADQVVANGDVLSVNRLLLAPEHRKEMSDARIQKYEPSISGFVTLAGVRRQYDALLHHTVFFPERYEPEFDHIFRDRKMPADPTIYICYSGYSEAGMAPAGASNLFILVNAPYLSDSWNWEQQTERYGAFVLEQLAARGITGLNESNVLIRYTPRDIERDTLAHQGSIYGISSNSVKQTFMRPGNRSKDVQGLWYVGGTTHPGGGTPIVTLSGQLVGEQLASEILR
ncbi:phytoene desaturase family protein [Paenibacillus sp. FSL R5-0766]|uniref:phytoene desaturase family protein n=1 Tax=unclassified Paenibacillus TaxID=185978 RepID=UPI00096C7F6B|nr:phytoene desaturase family protein [Paenibacillus sp. FSL R5-0765]OMF66541.1 phytoene dehydrogenase [Paenibacillus sp. FSL R5-0765]